MTRCLFACCIVLLVFPVTGIAQPAGYPDFEIVESVPLETNLENSDVRNAHDVWLEMINGAKRSLDIEEFYISDQKGEPLEDVLKAIVDAGARGVAVRIIIDASMHRTYPYPADSLGACKNIAVRVIDIKALLGGGVQHAKFFIVDGLQVYVGSQNFDWRSLNHIHEIGVRMMQPEAITVYRDIFSIDWRLAEKNDPALIDSFVVHKEYHLPIRVAESPGDTLTFFPTMSPKRLLTDSTLWDETNIVRLIDGAARNVSVQALTYSAQERGGERYAALDDALRRAAARGVTVRLLVSDWSLGRGAIESLKSLAGVPNIDVKYTAIPDYSARYIPFGRVEHCKFLVVDSTRCWIGTSNLEKGYFYSLRNMGVVVDNQRINGIMQRIFRKSWDGLYAHPIKSDGVYEVRPHGEKQ